MADILVIKSHVGTGPEDWAQLISSIGLDKLFPGPSQSMNSPTARRKLLAQNIISAIKWPTSVAFGPDSELLIFGP